MVLLQTRRFARQYKKLHDNPAGNVGAAIHQVTQNPDLGDRKKGDLAALRVFKFHSAAQLYLLGYTLDEGIRLVYLEAVGPHENRRLQIDRSGPFFTVFLPHSRAIGLQNVPCIPSRSARHPLA